MNDEQSTTLLTSAPDKPVSASAVIPTMSKNVNFPRLNAMFGLFSVLLILANAGTIREVIRFALDLHNSHASQILMVPFVSAWLLWTKRKAVFHTPRPCVLPGLGVMGFGALLFLYAHRSEPIFAPDPFVIQPPVIAHPRGIHRVVLSRLIPINLLFPRPNHNVAARRATRADALGFLQEPDAHLKTEILRRERADGADVHRVERVVVVERFAGVSSERIVAAAIDHTERVVADDVLREADAARAEDTALIVEHDARAEVNGLAADGSLETPRTLRLFRKQSFRERLSTHLRRS